MFYGPTRALADVSFTAPPKKVTALIGPSGCGKSTFLRCFNRMNDRIPGTRVEGHVRVDGMDPYARKVDLMQLRRKVGMVFQRPNPFPATIYENVAMAPRIHFGIKGDKLDEVVETALRRAALWDEVHDSLKKKSGMELSGGQQQRLCIARMLAVEPSVILMDEPCSALDPLATGRIEELIVELGKEYTVLIVTHNLQQAARVSNYTAFFMLGKIMEQDRTKTIFTAPALKVTDDYLNGRFG